MQRKNGDESREGEEKARQIKIMSLAEVKSWESAIRGSIDPVIYSVTCVVR